MPTVWKAVSPKKLKPKEFRLEALNRMRKVGTGMRKDARGTTKDFEGSAPDFESKVSLKAPGPTLEIVLTGDDDAINKYLLVDAGSPPHTIVPRGDYFLVFETGYTRLSTPGSLTTSPANSFGETVRARAVAHPGFEGADWIGSLIAKWTQPFRASMEQALDQAAKNSGHAIKK